MPIYEYKCLNCRAHLEKMQKVSDAPLTTCEKCGGKLEKQWSRSGFQFKGEGWYVTDYTNKKTEKSEKAGEKTEKSPAAESTAKTETASKEKSDTSAVKETSKQKE